MQTAIVLGTFDGLHSGHRAVIEKANGYNTVAVTFAVPPKAALGKDVKLLMTPEDKKAGLKALGVSRIYDLNFSDVADTSPDDFLLWLKSEFSPALIACGYNYRFGKNAAGGTDTIAAFCEQNGIEFRCAERVGNGEEVSSSALRSLIENGEVLSANRQIYGGFGFTSPVLHGDSRGKALGFPTANQMFPDNLVCPKFGVYSSSITVAGKEYPAITDVGIRPTYKTDFIGCETFIKDMKDDLYGQNATLKFIRFIRAEQKFSSDEELKAAVADDIRSVLGVII
ncbi:MAG: hypothetical protein IKZ47_01430 [Clostridia bacterium]|nr:hypothetical protein [Clostridia bacterium]